MLSIKQLLSRLCGRVNYRIVTVETPSFDLQADATLWITASRPATGKPIAVVGYYIRGTALVTIYNLRLINTGAQFAVKNTSSSNFTGLVIRADYLVVD